MKIHELFQPYADRIFTHDSATKERIEDELEKINEQKQKEEKDDSTKNN